MKESDVPGRWELKILSSIRREAKSERKIAKDIGLNSLITSQLITGLLSKCYIERILNRARIRRYCYVEKFAITQEGLSVLEEFARLDNPWNQLAVLMQQSYELPLKMTISAVMIAYRLAKFVLKP